MVPPHSLRIPRARRYSGYCYSVLSFAYETITLFGSSSQRIQLDSTVDDAVLTPSALLLSVWPLPLSLATTYGISFDFSSSAYLDVSVRRVPHVYLCIQYTFSDSSSEGFPHSEICGSKLICSSPQLIAACHVLRRLLMPRHSPYALLSLNFSGGFVSTTNPRFSLCLNCCVSRITVTLCFRLAKLCFYPIFGKTFF